MKARKKIQPKRARRTCQVNARHRETGPTSILPAHEALRFEELAPAAPKAVVSVEAPTKPERRDVSAEACGEPDESRADADDLS